MFARTQARPFRVTGFSLIEVMIAAVVLATGLLALSALQSVLIRNAADGRARSQIAAFVDLVAERQRAAGTNSFASIPSSTVWSADDLAAVRTSAGAGDLAVNVTATHYRYDAAANSGAGGFVTCDATCASGLSPKAAQYKEVRTVATWTDSTGVARRYDLTSTLSPRVIETSMTPLSTPSSGSSGGKVPIVRTAVPSDAGIIPIAIGNNTDTAATNPKPKVNSGAVVRTSFEVLTYRTEASSAVQQKRVETAVIGCKCSGTAFSSANPQFATAQWPAYWNGTRYVVYEPSSKALPPGATAGKAKASGYVQDELCTECCRDHHDTSATAVVKFDPYRFAAGIAHTHYKYSGGSLAVAESGDVYEESCRMIRVDGFWRVAADFNNDYFNFIATKNDGSANEYDPSASAQTNYQNMVLGYLGSRYTTGTAYNTALAAADVSALETTHSINLPTSISINRSGGVKWLHSRGMYLDFLEQDAIDAIAAAKAKAACAGSAMASCILPLVPITAVNLTEIAEYASASTVQVGVENNGFVQSTLANAGSQQPRRGKVFSGSNPVQNTTVNVTTEMTRSNAGLAVIRPIDENDATTQSDVQPFIIAGSAPPDGSGGTFTVTLTGYTFSGSSANSPVVSFTNAGGTNVTCFREPTNSYSCTASKLGVPTTIKISNYNYQSTSTANYSVGIFCSNNQSKPNAICPKTLATGRLCGNWAVTTAEAASPIGEGKAESTTLSYAIINPGDSFNVSLSLEGHTRGDTDGVTFQCSIGNGNKSCDDASVSWIDVCAGTQVPM